MGNVQNISSKRNSPEDIIKALINVIEGLVEERAPTDVIEEKIIEELRRF